MTLTASDHPNRFQMFIFTTIVSLQQTLYTSSKMKKSLSLNVKAFSVVLCLSVLCDSWHHTMYVLCHPCSASEIHGELGGGEECQALQWGFTEQFQSNLTSLNPRNSFAGSGRGGGVASSWHPEFCNYHRKMERCFKSECLTIGKAAVSLLFFVRTAFPPRTGLSQPGVWPAGGIRAARVSGCVGRARCSLEVRRPASIPALWPASHPPLRAFCMFLRC